MLKLAPYCCSAIWGGTRLHCEYGFESAEPQIAEAWLLSCHPNGPSIIKEGIYAGKTLQEYIEIKGRCVLGNLGVIFQEFPILIKLIDAADDLSIQVHPSNLYALEHAGGEYGKTEMWYILDAQPGAYIYLGVEHSMTREDFERSIENNLLQTELRKQPVKKGEHYYIPPGTIHGIGKGVLIAEIQQNSDITYRIYDYNRRDKHGKKRELHLAQAKDVAILEPTQMQYEFGSHLVRCTYFTVDERVGVQHADCDFDSFTSLLFLEGEGTLCNAEGSMKVTKGDSVFLDAGSGDYHVYGNCRYLCTRIGII